MTISFSPNYDTLDPASQLLDRLYHLALPVLTFAITNVAWFSMTLRNSLTDVLPEDYMLTAAAKGLTEDQQLLRREARDVLEDGGWGRDELAELDFLDRAVVYEEAGRANRGEEFFDADAPELERLSALALEAVGIAAKALDLAVEHAQTREQFGRPIGVYQAVSHQLADTYADVELARSLAYWAAWCVAEDDEQAPVAAAAAKAFAAEAAVTACERSIQVHGGTGFTWEHPLHRFYKRALWLEGFGSRPTALRAEVADAVIGAPVTA